MHLTLKKLQKHIHKTLKDHGDCHGHHHKAKGVHHARETALREVHKAAQHMIGCGLVHPDIIHHAHNACVKRINGAGWWDSIKDIGSKIVSGVKSVYNFAKPVLKPLIKFGIDKLAPVAENLLGSNTLTAPLAGLVQPLASMGHDFIDGTGLKKGSEAMRIRMAKVRACKRQSASGLFPAGKQSAAGLFPGGF